MKKKFNQGDGEEEGKRAINDMYALVEELMDKVKVLRFKDRFQEPMPCGYMDMQLLVQASA